VDVVLLQNNAVPRKLCNVRRDFAGSGITIEGDVVVALCGARKYDIRCVQGPH
jgi:hypothetical protein